MLLQQKVSCTEDVLDVMALGNRNRSVAETKMNERSSRSHSVLSVIVDGAVHETGARSHGCLHLIDLAGKSFRLHCLQAGAKWPRRHWLQQASTAWCACVASV